MGRISDDRYKVKVDKCSADVLGRACIRARETSDALSLFWWHHPEEITDFRNGAGAWDTDGIDPGGI
jgi:hypothetical protein